jgi:hypothetical protein
MQAETPDSARDAELAQLRATVLAQETSLTEIQAGMARQQALIATLLAERTTAPPAPAPRQGKRAKPTAVTAPLTEALPTSRRGLLKRLGTSAAGAAVAATALGASRPERAAATTDATIVGASTNQYGVYAASNVIVRPAVPSTVSTGVLGISADNANLATLGSTQASGVAGVTGGNTGVVGVCADQGLGVGGICIASTPRSLFATSAGVAGVSTTRTGVSGISGSNHGVVGQSQAPAGTVVSNDGFNPGGGMLAAGVAGRTSSTIALYGYADGPPNPSYAPVGTVGQCQNGFGVWGLSSAGPGATSRPGGGAPTAISGVLGTSTSGVGMYAISSGSYALAADGNGPTTVGALLRGLGGGKAAVCVGDVEIQGHLTVTGGVNGPVATQAVGTAQPSAALIEDVGRGRLERGVATVGLAPAVAAVVQGDDYDVFLTEYDNHQALYVTRRTAQGFEVRAKDAPTASGTFSYRVVARVRGAQAAGERAPAPLHVPTIPVPQGVPTLPVGRETPSSPPAPKPDAR